MTKRQQLEWSKVQTTCHLWKHHTFCTACKSFIMKVEMWGIKLGVYLAQIKSAISVCYLSSCQQLLIYFTRYPFLLRQPPTLCCTQSLLVQGTSKFAVTCYNFSAFNVKLKAGDFVSTVECPDSLTLTQVMCLFFCQFLFNVQLASHSCTLWTADLLYSTAGHQTVLWPSISSQSFDHCYAKETLSCHHKWQFCICQAYVFIC